MRTRPLRTQAMLLLTFIVLLSVVAGCGDRSFSPAPSYLRYRLPGTSAFGEPIPPVPEATKVPRILGREIHPAKARLGEELFHDARLSVNGTISCASCHDLEAAGIDGLERSIGLHDREVRRNSPTVFNSVFNFRQFWDGRAADLEEQIDLVIHSPEEMGTEWPVLIERLQEIDSYRERFATGYPDGITESNVKHALASFVSTLVTPNSRFDRYLRGDATALTEAELEGYRRFKSFGCVSCHQGVGVGGNMYQKLGIFSVPSGLEDLGRMEVTGEERDRYVFKVPSLRNVAVTPPYFHDGTVQSLRAAVRIMLRNQLGIRSEPEDEQLIVKFLGTLTGEYDGKPLE